jgi:hypothetical protein
LRNSGILLERSGWQDKPPRLESTIFKEHGHAPAALSRQSCFAERKCPPGTATLQRGFVFCFSPELEKFRTTDHAEGTDPGQGGFGGLVFAVALRSDKSLQKPSTRMHPIHPMQGT